MGECANPELETETGLRMHVRGRELHCRQGWGEDRWDMAADDVVLDIRVRRPDPGAGWSQLSPRVPGSRPIELKTAESIISDWGADTASEAGAER